MLYIRFNPFMLLLSSSETAGIGIWSLLLVNTNLLMRKLYRLPLKSWAPNSDEEEKLLILPSGPYEWDQSELVWEQKTLSPPQDTTLGCPRLAREPPESHLGAASHFYMIRAFPHLGPSVAGGSRALALHACACTLIALLFHLMPRWPRLPSYRGILLCQVTI